MSGAGISPFAYNDPQDYAKLLAIQRRQALGQNLLEQGSAVSTQPYSGLANAGRSLLGAYLLKHGDADQAALFSGGMGAGAPTVAPAPSQPAQGSNAPVPVGVQPPSVTPAGGAPVAPQTPSGSSPQGGSNLPSHLAAVYSSSSFPRIPGVDPQVAIGAMMQGGQAWQAYMTAYYQAVGPTPEMKNAMAATGGNQDAANELIRGTLMKGATQMLRPGGGALNMATGQFMGIPGQTGLTPTQMSNGQIGLTMAPGAMGAVSQAAQAQQFGRASATPDIVYDASGQGYPTSQAQMLGLNAPPPGASAPAGPSANAAPPNGGQPAPSFQTGGLAAAPPGASEFGGGIARSAAQQNQDLRTSASDVQTRLNVLGNILNLSRITQTNSPEWIQESRNLAAGLGQVLGHPVDATNQAALNTEIQKYMEQYATRMHQASGGTGTDAQLEAIQHANPNSEMFPATIQRVVPWIMANEAGIKAKANAQDSFGIKTPADQTNFENFWRNNYTPRIAQFEMMTLPQKQGYLNDPNAFPTKQSKIDFYTKYKALHSYFMAH